jgi:hypothetical protein
MHADVNQRKVAQVLSPHGEVWQVTEPSLDAAKHLKRLALKNPPAVLHLT